MAVPTYTISPCISGTGYILSHPDTDWPGEQHIHDFTQQAESLFIWISIIGEYSLTVVYPDRKPSTLLYKRTLSSIRTAVLSDCDWSDHHFVHDYNLIM